MLKTVYADDIVLMAKSKQELQNEVTEWASAIRDNGMRINVQKRKVIVLAWQMKVEYLNINWEGRELEQVNEFDYLGKLITSDGKADEEIKTIR